MADLADPARLRALAATGLIDAPVDERMQRISRLVSRIVRAPVALASFVDAERQFFVAAHGFDVEPYAAERQTPLSHSFCQHVVLQNAPLRVPDARKVDFLAENDAIPDLGVVAYLGVPLRSQDGHLLGSLCAIDGQPREWTAEEEEALTDLAALVTDELTLRAAERETARLAELLHAEARRDPLTGMFNRREWEERAQAELSRARRDGWDVAALVLDLDEFKQLNDTYGHGAGDEVLMALHERWKPMLRETDLLVRWGGDEFVVLLTQASVEQAREVGTRLAHATGDLIGMTFGCAAWDGEEDVAALVDRADADLINRKALRRLG